MDKNYFCVIMAGGIGSRFWPYSRVYKPKQFLDILGNGRSLLQQTVERFKSICPLEQILVVTHAEYEQQILEQIPEMKTGQILKEPMRKNTAPCIAYANARIQQINPDARIVVTPSDHLITDEKEFSRVVLKGLEYVGEHDALLTLGIQPSRPETGYGYIQANKEVVFNEFSCLREVKTFTEKPNIELARIFLESGDFFWNSGMFIWSLSSINQAFKRYLPDMLQLFQGGMDMLGTDEETAMIEQVYGACDKISIDYGIMEKADNVYVACADFGWSDLGTWGSLYDLVPHDREENGVSTAQLMSFDSNRNMVYAKEGKLIVLQGLNDYIVVDTDDVLLVCRKEDEQYIREIVDEVKMRKGKDFV